MDSGVKILRPRHRCRKKYLVWCRPISTRVKKLAMSEAQTELLHCRAASIPRKAIAMGFSISTLCETRIEDFDSWSG